ncbi:CCR4-NOT transcription complex subunit 1-like isoform X2 [Clavelina lepadiformis]|uniref:CCR4-NOT transcription complex subunit 1 n=1 Tax=Clavelina lepadiformis TaxID=159417 RepID=A0ABP0FNK4_CLALP
MNLDSLSLTVSQISYLVANLSKKNYNKSTSELTTLVERHGTEAERHLFRCLFSWIDFGGDVKSTGKDYHQTQLLTQEFVSLTSRPSLITTICNSIENPLSHQKTLAASSSLIPNISRVLHFSKVQEIAFGICLQHSANADLAKQGSQFVERKLPELVRFLTESGNSKRSGEQDIGLQDSPVEIQHLLLLHLPQGGLTLEQKQSFFTVLRKEYPSDRCPLILLPYLYQSQEDIHMERLLVESTPSPIMSSSSNSGNQKSSAMNSVSLANILQEMGHASCASLDECRKTLSILRNNLSAGSVARVIAMMVRTANESLDNVTLLPALSGGGVWSDNKDKSEDQVISWNVDNFIQVAKEMNQSLNTRDVFLELDHPGFVIMDVTGFRLVVRALQLLLNQHESFPIEVLYKKWTNTRGQLSWIQQSLMNSNVFCIADYPTRTVNVDILKQPLDEENSDILTWKSLDLVECLIHLSDLGVHYDDVRRLFEWPFNNCPDLLMLSLAQSGTSWQALRRDLVLSLLPVFLGSHPNSAMVLSFLWNGQSQSNIMRQLMMLSMAEWYMRSDQYDQQKLSRVLDIAQDLKALPMLLNSTPFSFVIDLAVLASRREYLKLDKWLSDKIREHREEFIQACVNFLKRRCPSVLGGLHSKDDALASSYLSPETLTTMLSCLQSYTSGSGMSQELSDTIVTMVANCSNLINKSRQALPGVMAKPRPTPPAPQPPQPNIPTPPSLPQTNPKVENLLTKSMDPVTGVSGYAGNKAPMQPQSALPGFGTTSDFPNPAAGSVRIQPAIGSNNPSNMSSPGGAGILPPNSGMSDGIGMGSGISSNNPGGMGPVGAPGSSGGQFVGGASGFSASIAQGLGSQLGGGNSSGLGLSGAPTSSSAGFGPSQFGFGGSQLMQGFPNQLLGNLGNVGGTTSVSDSFAQNKFDSFSNQKPELFRSKMDIFSQQKPSLGNTGGMGVGLGSTLGTGMGSGLDMFGKKSSMGSLGPAAQQAFQQAAAKAPKPMSDLSQVWPEMNQQFSKDIEDEANGYFQRIYNQPPHPTLSVDEILDLLQKFKDSNNKQEREVFNCMMRNLFEEYRFFPQYPDKELHITACLFGGIIEKNLVTYLALGIALRYVLEALRKPHNTKMYYFGIAALDRFKLKLKDYPQYCIHIASISHFKSFPGHLVEFVESGRQSEEPLNKTSASVTTPGSLAFAAQQHQLGLRPLALTGGEGGSPHSGTPTPSAVNPVPMRAASAGAKISLTGAIGKEMQQPSIAKATNIDTLLGAKIPEEKIPEPPEGVQDKIAFIFNNLSVSNMTPKSDEMRDAIKDEHTPWLSQYLVMKRVSIEPNFHLLYSNFLDCLKISRLNELVQEEVYRNITVLLQSDKTVANFSDRSLLKNLGHFLGIISLAKNKPILHDDIALKPLLYEAYSKGAQELLYVVPFVAKVLESVGKSKVFKLPNPWTEAIMSVLVELHMEPDLKLNLKFEVEVLCKNLQIDISDIKPAHYLKDPEVKYTLDTQQLSTSSSSKDNGASSKPSTPSEQPQAVPRSTAPMIMGGIPGPPLSSGFPPPGPPLQQQQAPMPMPALTPRFSFHDINVYSIATLQSHLIIKMELPLLQNQPQLKDFVKPAVERSVRDVLQPAVERAIKIALTTSEQIVRKDFALDPEEFRMRTAAQHMVRNLTAGMALITCREQLLQGISNHLKQNFIQALTRQHPQSLGPQQKEMVDQAASVIAADNVELACCFIQKTAVERAIMDMDKKMATEYELRKHARQEGRRYCDPGVLTYQAERMPEQIRLKVGGVTQLQTTVYEEFAHCIPGFLPSNDSSQPSGFLSKPMQSWAVDEMTQVYERCIAELEQRIQMMGLKQNTPLFSQLQSLHESLVLARNSREVVTALALLQKAVEGLLDSPGQGSVEQDALVRYRECHLLILKALQDQQVYGPQWTNKHVTQCLINHRDEYKYNVEAVELLIRSHLVNMQQYDQHLAQAMENGLNYMALVFAMQLVKLFLVEENKGSPVSESDFYNTIEILGKINTMSRGASPDGLPQLIEVIKSNFDSMLDKAPGGPTQMMHSGISQAREYDDPAGLHEKTEYLLREWVNIYHSPASGRDSTRGFSSFVQQMHQQGILRTDDLITRFFRLCTEMCVDLTYRLLQESNVSPSLLNPTLVRAKCFHTLDAFVRLITLLVKHSGDAVNSVTKINLLNKVLGIVVGVLLHDHETRQMEYHQMPYHRIFIMLFYELNAPEHVLESINFQTLTAFTNTYHILRPNKAPGFAFAWLELISYRAFISRMLLHTPQQKGWPMYAQLLIDLFKFLAPFLRNVEMTKSIQILYKGTLRLLLVLLHDFPEFLCDYHYGFCDVIPANCIQLRNLILSAFPRNMRLPDPFTPNLKVDMLQEINVAPRILTNFVAVMPGAFQKDLDSYLKTRAPVTFVSDLRSNLQLGNEPGLKYNIPLINSLVMYVGTQAIAYIHGKGGSPSMATITHASHMDIFQNLAVDLDTEGRYLFLNAIANQLRYPNSHTHYFSCTLLYLFAEANQESIQEQITRVLLERLIVNRPHPWGLLITFIELIKNPSFKFWSHEFVHCAPEISKLFESVARSCMGKQFNQQAAGEASTSTASPATVVQSS